MSYGKDRPFVKVDVTGVVDQRFEALEQEHREQEQQTAILHHGTQVIESDQASPLNVELYGNTKVNISSPIGACEDTSLWGSNYQVSTVLDSANKIYGNNAIKVTQTVSGSIGILRTTKELEVGKYYVWIIEIKNIDASYIDAYANAGGTAVYGNQITSTSKYGLSFVKFSPTQSLVYFGANIYSSAIGSAYVDGGRLYEIDQETYNEIGVTLTDADVERLFPYVDSVQHVKNPVLSVEGSNLVHSFDSDVWDLHANVTIDSPSKLTHENTSGSTESSKLSVNAKSNLTYSLSLTHNSKVWIQVQNSTGILANKAIASSSQSFTFTTNPDTVKIWIVLETSAAGTYTFENIMLNLGTEPKPFVPRNPSYLYAETTLAGNDNKEDILTRNSSTNQWEVIKHFVSDEALTVSTDTTTLAEDAVADTCIIVDDADGSVYTRVDTLSGSGNEFTQTGTTITFNATNVPMIPLATYQRESEIVKVLDNGEVEGSLSIEGDAQVTVGSGFTYTTDDEGNRTYTILPDDQRYNFTANLTDAVVNYQSSLKSSFQSVVSKQSDLATENSILKRQMLNVLIRLDALEGGA